MKDGGAPKVRFVDSHASVLFDLLRGLAALLVFSSHARNFFFFDYSRLQAPSRLLAIPYTLTGAGHQAVVVFFVLSGFFISGSVFQAFERKRWSWTDYLLRRLVRLWVVLVPALILCFLLDRVGIRHGHGASLYSNLSFTPASWWGTLFFTQNILVPIFGSDSALWSLANEFWYYMLFPLGFLAMRQATPVAQRLLYAALALAVAWFIRGDILLEFPIWLTGTLLTRITPPSFPARTGRRALIFATPLYLLVLFGTSRNRSFSTMAGDYLLTAATFGFLWLLLSARDRAPAEALPVRLSRDLARFSYSLYALHIPPLLLATSLIVGENRWAPTASRALIVAGICAAILAYAYALASLTEFRTDALRRRVEKLFGLPAPRSILPSNPAAD
jgi:peptidoglycan/LPS O-acetylase OafA/YrhL